MFALSSRTSFSPFFHSETIKRVGFVTLYCIAGKREPAMIVCLRAAAIAGVMAVLASTSVMAQTTGTIPPQPPPYGVAPSQPPPTASQYSSNELIDAGQGEPRLATFVR